MFLNVCISCIKRLNTAVFLFLAELLVDKAMELKYVGGVYGGNVKPAPFLCLILKMLQIQPEKDIIVEFISQPDFKYVSSFYVLACCVFTQKTILLPYILYKNVLTFVLNIQTRLTIRQCYCFAICYALHTLCYYGVD